MARIPLVAVSVASAVVLFVGTSAAILAIEGRIGPLFGKGTERQGETAKADGKVEAGAKAASRPAGAAVNTNKTEPKEIARAAVADPGPAGAGAPNTTKTFTNDPESRRADSGEVAVAEARWPAASGGEPVTPKRIATASLVEHFTLPEPFTAKELEELVDSIKETQRSHESLAKELAVQKGANERDRADLDARFAELDALRKKLEQEKAEVTSKVAELAKRNDRLMAGEEKFVKATIARLSTLKADEAKTQLLDLDEGIAARVLQRMEPKACAKLLAILPAEKRVSLTKQLRALSLADEEQQPSPGAPEATK
jgi:flagellar motility protein MotE (MotC chaperone)